ncbi:T9SS type A sorting domain-containing protein [Aequorivita sp. SDUM287046]|uniref:T9SS type A sorting domain-containing protein n=1 Tax=Aequorivita aurantiaca TaxID=3053356 RepID=A0ABT8DJV4_9FLAO|nr:T9SS type A sorting domain-containing protein [Aequorivita aurantiaca]MDN3723307.1 T9SS type A sorting domain-containing protein [Aequorivita aurantiaca]
MKTTTTLLALLLSLLTINAQDPHIQWQKTIGGSGTELLWSIIETTDGGIFIGGTSDSNISGEKTEDSRGGQDFWVLKLDNNGNILWQKTYGGSADDVLVSALQTSEGGFIIGGVSKSDISGDKTENSRGDDDYWILKLNSNGNIEWQKTFGGNEYDRLGSLVKTNDGGYLLAGHSHSPISGDRTVARQGFSDAWVLKLDSSGAIMWQNAYNIENAVTVYGLDKTNDGGFIISSNLDISGNPLDPFWILKIDASGNQVWDRIISGDKIDLYPKIKSTTDGGYIVAGGSNSDAVGDKTEDAINGSFDYWVLKLDETGNIIWQNTIGGAVNENIHSIAESNDGGYFLSGNSNSDISGDKTENSIGGSDFWVVKINNVGIIEWQNTIGGGGSEHGGNSIQTSDGDFLTVGYSNSDISGDKTENSRGGFDYWIIKHDATLGINENVFASTISIYPNPVKNILQVNSQDKIIDKINIYSILGSLVRQLDVETVSPTVDVSSLALGVYYIQLYSGKNVALKKFVKE